MLPKMELLSWKELVWHPNRQKDRPPCFSFLALAVRQHQIQNEQTIASVAAVVAVAEESQNSVAQNLVVVEEEDELQIAAAVVEVAAFQTVAAVPLLAGGIHWQLPLVFAAVAAEPTT